jgi:hypothetical protein
VSLKQKQSNRKIGSERLPNNPACPATYCQLIVHERFSMRLF